MFRLKTFAVVGHPILKTLNLTFCDDEPHGAFDNDKDIYTSVIIGTNGIGKSYLLRAIAEVFTYLEQRKLDVNKFDIPQYRFSIVFYNDGNTFGVSNIIKKDNFMRLENTYATLNCTVNGTRVPIRRILLPEKIIASTMTITDKFNSRSLGSYRYKGIRSEQSPSMTGTRTLIRKTVNSLFDSLDVKIGFQEELMHLLSNIGLEQRLTLTYAFRHKDIFIRRDIDVQHLRNIYSNWKEYFPRRTTQPWGTSNFNKIKDNDRKMSVLVSFLRKLAIGGFNFHNSVLRYELFEETERIKSDKEALEILSSIDLLSFPSLQVYKRNEDYAFSESSSGETHLLCQFIGIMSDLSPNSLILIDEPENSCHPNWQINYISWLKNIFKKYCDCHFVIATHSHFLLTDLQPQSSNIVALERTEEGLHNIADGVNTFCWTVDDILYRVFHVRNTRNYVFEKKLLELYGLLELKTENKDRIKVLYNELSQYKINEDDPLNILLNQAQNA